MLRLLTLLAVLLLPLGMAPAAANPAQHRGASMPIGHCSGQAPAEHTKGAFAGCVMACSAALPAAELPGDEPRPIGSEPVRAAAIKPLCGLHPETATPPPRRA